MQIPTTLPNPHSLTFTGAASASYSGAEEVVVNVPLELPSVNTNDNGKFLRVANGVWAAEALINAEEVAY